MGVINVLVFAVCDLTVDSCRAFFAISNWHLRPYIRQINRVKLGSAKYGNKLLAENYIYELF